MKQMSIGKVVIATTTFACTALFSVGWSEQSGVSLSIESAHARIGRPYTPLSVAGVARRQYRRAGYGYGYGAGLLGAGVAAAAIGTAAASPWGYYGGGYPGYYTAYGAGYPAGNYGAFGDGYPGYYGGVYSNRSYVTGRPTLFPRYYGGGW